MAWKICCLGVIFCEASCSLGRCQQLSRVLAHKGALVDDFSSSCAPSLSVSRCRHVILNLCKGVIISADTRGCIIFSRAAENSCPEHYLVLLAYQKPNLKTLTVKLCHEDEMAW